MNVTMKAISEDEVEISAEGKQYIVSKSAAMAIKLILPNYAEMVVMNVMPTYKMSGIEAARTQLKEMREKAIESTPASFKAANEFANTEGQPVGTRIEYGIALINIVYDCVGASLERHYEEIGKHKLHGEELPSRQEMN